MEFGLSGAFAGTLQARINVVFRGVVNFPWFQQWNALVSESARACQHNFDSFPATVPGRAGSDVARPLHSAMRQRARAVGAKSVRTDRHLSPIAKILTPASVSMVLAEPWDEASDLAQISA